MREQFERLPQNLEAERMTLGVVILDNGVAPQALYELSPDEFALPSHRHVFDAMRALDRAGRQINPLTLQDELAASEKLEAIGGPAYIASLFEGCPKFSDIREYVRLIKEAGLKRKALHLSNWLGNEAQAPDVRVEDLISALEAKVEELAESRQVDDLISSEASIARTMTTLEERWRQGNKVIGLTTGFPDLDRVLLGLRGRKYYVIASGTGGGKTTLMLNVADSIVCAPYQDGPRVGLIISLEMGTEELDIKFLSAHTRIDSYRIETGELTEAEKRVVREAAELRKRIPIEYVEGFSKVTARSLTSRVNKVRRKYGRLDYLMVDYLQLLDDDEAHENEHMRLSAISRALKRIAHKHNIPVITLSQFNRDHSKRGGQNRDYQLSDLKGSGSIEQDADVVMFLMPEDWDDEDNPNRRLFIAKQRGGKKNVTVRLVFFGDQSRFESAASEDQVFNARNPLAEQYAESVGKNGHKGNGRRSKKYADHFQMADPELSQPEREVF